MEWKSADVLMKELGVSKATFFRHVRAGTVERSSIGGVKVYRAVIGPAEGSAAALTVGPASGSDAVLAAWARHNEAARAELDASRQNEQARAMRAESAAEAMRDRLAAVADVVRMIERTPWHARAERRRLCRLALSLVDRTAQPQLTGNMAS